MWKDNGSFKMAELISNTVASGNKLSITQNNNGSSSITGYVLSQNYGYAGIDFSLDQGTTWLPLKPISSDLFNDTFSGANGTPLNSMKWEVTKAGDYDNANSHVQHFNGLGLITVKSLGTGYAMTQLTSKKEIPTAVDNVISFNIDENVLTSGTFELKVGLAPVKPPTGTDVSTMAGYQLLLHFHSGKVHHNGVEHTITAPNVSQKYEIHYTSYNVSIYRGTTKIFERPIAYNDAYYYLSFSTFVSPTAGLKQATIDDVLVNSKNASAKVLGGIPWSCNVNESIDATFKLTFENSIDHTNEATLILFGKA